MSQSRDILVPIRGVLSCYDLTKFGQWKLYSQSQIYYICLFGPLPGAEEWWNLFFNLDQLKPVPFQTLFSSVCAYCANIMDTKRVCLLVPVIFINGIPVPLTENTKTYWVHEIPSRELFYSFLWQNEKFLFPLFNTSLGLDLYDNYHI